MFEVQPKAMIPDCFCLMCFPIVDIDGCSILHQFIHHRIGGMIGPRDDIYIYTYGSFPVIKIMAMMEFPSLESLVLLGCLSLNSAQNHLQSPDLVKNWYVPQIPGNRSNNFEHLICRHPSRGTLQAGLIKTALEHHRRSNLFMPVS